MTVKQPSREKEGKKKGDLNSKVLFQAKEHTLVARNARSKEIAKEGKRSATTTHSEPDVHRGKGTKGTGNQRRSRGKQKTPKLT